MSPRKSWSAASAPLIGITEMMNHIRDRFGRTYAPNTRETIRRETVHQFVQLGLVVQNPDRPDRPVNSPATRYQASSGLVVLARLFGTDAWPKAIEEYSRSNPDLSRLGSRERAMRTIPVRLPSGVGLKLSSGRHNELVKQVIEQFCPRFTPGGVVLYVGDTVRKDLFVDASALARIGLKFDRHGKLPDIVVHYERERWLVLIEAVTSHGPVDLKRHNELRELFSGSRAGLVFVTAFSTRAELARYVGVIAWETDVWVAESPSHLIHFDGQRFLGPYS